MTLFCVDLYLNLFNSKILLKILIYMQLQNLFCTPIVVNGNHIQIAKFNSSFEDNQVQTNDVFSKKWLATEEFNVVHLLYKLQYSWFMDLYGFEDEVDLTFYLKERKIIIDTGCGLGYKSYWFSKLAPDSIVIGIDLSDAIYYAIERYKECKNLYFLKADISNTFLRENSCDFVVCDQVIMHTENPDLTFKHLNYITKIGREIACYFYRKKALPRELVDDYFRLATHNIQDCDMWLLADQLTELGRVLSDLNVKFISPEIPLLGIKGGEYDIQRFIYWNFLKCFWNPDWGRDLSKVTNYDWYSPSNARRYDKIEIDNLLAELTLSISYWHEEEACFSGRFRKN